jgi:hypothetical protein
MLACVDGFLCLDQSGYEIVEVGWLTSLTAMMCRSGVVAVWRVKPARVVYGHFYFSMSEALLRTETWQRQRTCPTVGVFRCLTVPPHKTRVRLRGGFSFSSSQVP